MIGIDPPDDAQSEAIVDNVVVNADLYRFQVRYTVTFRPPADHPAVRELLVWHHQQQRAKALASDDPPAFGPI